MNCLKNLVADFFDYETPVILRTKSKRVGIIHRLIQILTLTFFFVYSIGYLKGYQLTSDAMASVVHMRIRGELQERFREMVYEEGFLQYCKFEIESYNPDQTVSTFHGNLDVMIPLYFEVMTQERTTCPEDPTIRRAKCNPRFNKCAKNKRLPMGNGRMTGRCIPAIITNDTVCEIFGWCPVISTLTPYKYVKNVPKREYDTPDSDSSTFSELSNNAHTGGLSIAQGLADNLMHALFDINMTGPGGIAIDPKYIFLRQSLWTSFRNVTVLIKNPVFFSAFKESRTNYNTSGTPCWRNTNYNDIPKSCPIYTFRDILDKAAEKLENVSAVDIIRTGGVINCIINWECDFDKSQKGKSCTISYDFSSVNQARSGIGLKTWYLNNGENGDSLTKRHAVRVSCIRFVVSVEGIAGKFDVIQLLFKLGAAVGLFSIATLLCEYVFLHTDWLVKRTVVEMKYMEPMDGEQGTKNLVIVQSGSKDHGH